MAPIRVAVIGAGKQSSKHHLPILKRLSEKGECSLVVVCDLNAATATKAKETFGFAEAATDASAVCMRADVDAVYVVGTVTMHFEFMMQALRAGKHVFVEKPPAKNTTEMLEAALLAKQSGKIAVAGFNRRFYPSINAIKHLLKDKAEIYSIEGAYNKAFLRGTYAYDSSSWITYSSIHGIDALLYLMGAEPPSELYSTWNTVPDAEPENLSALFVWPSGAHAILSSNNTAGSRMENYVVHTLGKSYACDEEKVTTFAEGEEHTKVFDAAEDSSGFYAEHLEFLGAIRGGAEPRNSIRRSVAVMHVSGLIEAKHKGPIDWTGILDRAENSVVSSTAPAPRLEKREVISRPSILILNPGGMKHALSELSKSAIIVYPDAIAPMPEGERRKISAIITGIGGGTEVTEEILAQLPCLRVVGVVGASVKKYNPEGILAKGVPILSASSVYADAVAEFNLLQALVGIKNASRAHDVMRRGGWGIAITGGLKQKVLGELAPRVGAVMPASLRKLIRTIIPRQNQVAASTGSEAGARGGKNLHGLTVGLIGYGAISKKFIELLKPFACKIKVHSDHLSIQEAEAIGVVKATLADALNADIVSLHRGLSERTRGSFGASEFESLKPGAIFINAARGELVDEGALLKRLKKGDIFACLDVFAEEPLPRRSPFRKLPNVFLSSHIAGATKETYGLAGSYVAATVLAYLRGEEVSGLIDTLARLGAMS